MTSFTVEKKNVSIFPAAGPDRPVIYLNTFEEEGRQIYELAQAANCPDFSLVAVSGLAWNHDLSPWETPSLTSAGEPFTGGGETYLSLLTDTILPRAEEMLPGPASWRGVAGYSLAGLFAVYSLYQTDRFTRGASISGSLWFPNIKEYIFSHKMKRRPDCLYFSLGDKEHKTRNPVMRAVRRNTEEIQAFYQAQGIDAVFQLNPGNHFQNAPERTVNAIQWMVRHR